VFSLELKGYTQVNLGSQLTFLARVAHLWLQVSLLDWVGLPLCRLLGFDFSVMLCHQLE
jgi:hypothetical protein